MYVSDDLIFLELQKTGGSHILRLLDIFFDGEIIGKHNRLKFESIGERFVFGSIRNPWDWYVSLWAYGGGNMGAIRHRTTTGVDLNYYHADLPNDMGKNWLTPKEFMSVFWNDLKKPTEKWEVTYNDSNIAENFRIWLKMILNYEYRFDVGEGYAFSPLSKHSGLMTYRYFRLFTFDDKIYKDKRISKMDSLRDFDKNNSISKGMIRTEFLEDDFIEILNNAGKIFTEKQVQIIKSQNKTNTSRRKKLEFYYNQETIDLVAEKEQFIIKKYGYATPSIV